MAHQLQDGPDLFGSRHPESLEVLGRLQAGESVSTAEAATPNLVSADDSSIDGGPAKPSEFSLRPWRHRFR